METGREGKWPSNSQFWGLVTSFGRLFRMPIDMIFSAHSTIQPTFAFAPLISAFAGYTDQVPCCKDGSLISKFLVLVCLIQSQGYFYVFFWCWLQIV